MEIRIKLTILKRLLLLVSAFLLFVITTVGAQVFQFDNEGDSEIYGNEITDFQWIRGQYTNHAGGSRSFGRRGGGWWDTDYPDSDENFLRGVQRYARLSHLPSLTHPR